MHDCHNRKVACQTLKYITQQKTEYTNFIKNTISKTNKYDRYFSPEHNWLSWNGPLKSSSFAWTRKERIKVDAKKAQNTYLKRKKRAHRQGPAADSGKHAGRPFCNPRRISSNPSGRIRIISHANRKLRKFTKRWYKTLGICLVSEFIYRCKIIIGRNSHLLSKQARFFSVKCLRQKIASVG